MDTGDAVVAEGEVPSKLFGRGKLTQLFNLPGELAKWNGMVLTKRPPALSAAKNNERNYPTQFYEVRLAPNLVVEVGQSNMRAVDDPDWWDPDSWATVQHEQPSSKVTPNQRCNMKTTVNKFTQQIRRALDRANMGTTAELFAAMDSDNNDNIDKMELLRGCDKIGVHIAPSEIELMWPMFDYDGNGVISLAEFTDFVEEHRHAGRPGRRKSVELAAFGKIARHRRIRMKTVLRSHLGECIIHAREMRAHFALCKPNCGRHCTNPTY
jgi:hypothetical protein